MIDNKTTKEVIHLTGHDNKMLLINDRYYCQFTDSNHNVDFDSEYCVFSCFYTDDNSKCHTQEANVYVLDSEIGMKTDRNCFGKIYHNVNEDLENCKDIFMLMLDNPKRMINAVSIAIVDVPYKLKNLISLLKCNKAMQEKIKEPINCIEGVSFVDLDEFNKKHLSLEYSINGKLYVEIVDFNDMHEMGIVNLNDNERRNIIINYEKLDKNNVDEFAEKINNAIQLMK